MNITFATIEPAAGLALGFGALLGLFTLMILLFMFGLFIFWIIMLVDALTRKNWPSDETKIFSIIILISSLVMQIWWLAGLLYYYIVKRPLDSGKSISFFGYSPNQPKPNSHRPDQSRAKTSKKKSTKKS